MNYIEIVNDLNNDIDETFGVTIPKLYHYICYNNKPHITCNNLVIFDESDIEYTKNMSIELFEDYLESKVAAIGLSFLKYSFIPKELQNRIEEQIRFRNPNDSNTIGSWGEFFRFLEAHFGD